MLIALLVMTFLSLGGSEPFDRSYIKAVRQNVAQEETRDEVIGLLKEANRLSRDLTRDTAALVKDLEETAKDFKSTRDDYLPTLADLGEVRTQAQARYTDIVFKMRDGMTREQWQVVFDRD